MIVACNDLSQDLPFLGLTRQTQLRHYPVEIRSQKRQSLLMVMSCRVWPLEELRDFVAQLEGGPSKLEVLHLDCL